MNRRGFLWSLGVGAGTLVAAPALSLVPDPSYAWDIETVASFDMAKLNAILKDVYLPLVSEQLNGSTPLLSYLIAQERA